jgi:hypothetical protein
VLLFVRELRGSRDLVSTLELTHMTRRLLARALSFAIAGTSLLMFSLSPPFAAAAPASGNEQSRQQDSVAPGEGRSERDNDESAKTTENERLTVVGYPPGKYRETCRNIHTAGQELIAECRTWDGDWHRTRLADYGACGERIVNDDGRLRCGTRKPGRSQRDAGARGAEERDAGARDGSAPPSGSYQDSCRNSTFARGVIKAECRARQGWKDSEFADARSCRGDIANDGGRLVCRIGHEDSWGRITLFIQPRYSGERRAYDGDTPDLGPFSARASSASVSGGTWQLCTQRRYGGRCVTIKDSVRDFVDIGLDDRVRSIRRVKQLRCGKAIAH